MHTYTTLHRLFTLLKFLSSHAHKVCFALSLYIHFFLAQTRTRPKNAEQCTALLARSVIYPPQQHSGVKGRQWLSLLFVNWKKGEIISYIIIIAVITTRAAV